MLWCPVTNKYHSSYAIITTRIFPRKQYLTARYGDAAANDLNTEHNAMMMSAGARDRFTRYELALVPDIEDPTSEEQVPVWRRAEPKKYKIYISQPHPKSMQIRIPYSDKFTYADLDGCQAAFDPSSTAHPRPRYTYFHYFCCTVKNSSSNDRGPNVRRSLLGSQFWRFLAFHYLPKAMLIGAVHQCETTEMHKRTEKEEEVADFTAIRIADQLLLRSERDAEGEDEGLDEFQVSDEEG